MTLTKCAHCDKEAKIYYPKNRPSPRQYKTCGSKECAHPDGKNRGENARRASLLIKKNCKKCGNQFQVNSPRQMFCKICAPSQAFTFSIKEYGIGEPEYKSMLIVQDGLCCICRNKKAIHIDHNHKTGNVRGLLCAKCNMMVGFLEDKILVDKATKYLEIYK